MDKFKELKRIFEENANAKKAEPMAKYMRNQFAFYGIGATKRKELTKEFIKQAKTLKTIDWDFLDKCYKDNHREFQYFANDYLLAMQKYLSYDNISHLLKYAKIKPWWDTIDFLDKIIGNIGLKDKRVNSLMLKLSKDKDFWLCRIAIDHQNTRKEKTDKELLEKIVVNNFGSDEFFINKAIGWSLREYSKINPKWVKSFIKKYANQMSNLSIKQAQRYMLRLKK